MKIAIVSDVHGNSHALEAVIADALDLGAEAWVNLGDAIGYGPDPDLVITRLALLRALSVRGNHEQGLLRPSLAARFSRDAQIGLAHAMRRLTPAARLYISLLPAARSEYGARFVHGMPPSSIMRYLSQCDEEELEKRFQAFEEGICFVGHTHTREIICQEASGDIVSARLFDGRHVLDGQRRFIVSVGSVGFPRSDEKGAQYVVWQPEKHVLVVRTVGYENQAVKQRMVDLSLSIRQA